MSAPESKSTSSPTCSGRIWRFGALVLDERERQLTRDGCPLSLSPKAFDLLVALVERNGRLVRRQELMDLLWSQTFIEDATLDRHVSDVRKALGEAAGLLRTVPKAGYRFSAEIEEADPEESRQARSDRARRRFSGQRWAAASAGAAVVLLILAGVGWVVSRRAFSPLSPPGSVAVLPFTPIGDARGDEHLEIGLADVLITRLSQLPDLEVRPLGSVARYAGTTVDPLAVGRSLGVDAVLEGTLRRRDGRLRVSARLLSVASGHALWAGSFDHAAADLVAVEDAIGREATIALRPAPRRDLAGSAQAQVDSEAHDLYLRGRYFWAKRNSAGNRRAVELFDAALARAPDYAEAEVGLGASYALLAGLAEPPELYEEARRHAARALVLDPGSADAHAVLGLVAENYDGDWPGAEHEYRLALALQPNHPTTHHWFGEMLALQGRFEEGISLLERAERLDPLSLAIATDLAKAHYFARNWDEAVVRGEEVLAMDSQYAWAWAWVGAAELERGAAERGLECLTRFAELEASPFASAFRIWALVATGELEEAHSRRQSLEVAAEEGYVMPVALAMARLAVGDEEAALDALEDVLSRRQNRVGVFTTPLFDELRDQPRFLELMRMADQASAESERPD